MLHLQGTQDERSIKSQRKKIVKSVRSSCDQPSRVLRLRTILYRSVGSEGHVDGGLELARHIRRQREEHVEDSPVSSEVSWDLIRTRRVRWALQPSGADLARVGLGNGTEPREMIETKGGVAIESQRGIASGREWQDRNSRGSFMIRGRSLRGASTRKSLSGIMNSNSWPDPDDLFCPYDIFNMDYSHKITTTHTPKYSKIQNTNL